MRDLILAAAEHATSGNIRQFAALLNTPERTMRAWIAGTTPVPGAAQALFRLLAAHPKLAKNLKPRE
jgi:DNA-binding transcriptional regulator YiaG